MTSMSPDYSKIAADFLRLFSGPKKEAEKRTKYAEKAYAKAQDKMKDYDEWNDLVNELLDNWKIEEANWEKLSFAKKQLLADEKRMVAGKNPDRRTLKWLRNLLTPKTKKYEKKLKAQQKFTDELKTTRNALRELEKQIKRATKTTNTAFSNYEHELNNFIDFYDREVQPAFERYHDLVGKANDANASLSSTGPRTAKERMENAVGLVRT